MKFAAALRKGFTPLLAVLIVLLAGSVVSAQLKGYEKAKAQKEKSQIELFKNDAVVAAGIAGDSNGQVVIKVFLKKKNTKFLPKKLGTTNVEVEYIGNVTAWHNNKPRRGKPPKNNGSSPRDRFPRPVPIGVSVGTTTLSYCFAGTMGCRVKLVDLTNNSVVSRHTLSNNHVYAEENAGLIGVDGILQPGTLDNNCTLDPNDVIGVLEDFVPIKFNGSANSVDAAIASASASDVGVSTPNEGWGTPSGQTVAAFPGQVVQKYGRTTAYTEGTVDSINVTVNVGYDNGTALFQDQIIIRGRRQRGKRYVSASFSDGGDSGSLIVDGNNNAVGLLFAGNSTVTIANPINDVLDAFSDVNNGYIMMIDNGN